MSLTQHACVSACWVIFRGVCYLQTFILTSLKDIFHVSDRVRVHEYKRHNFKQFEALSKFRAWSESRLFANVISGVTNSGDSWSKRPTISKQTMGILSGRARRVGGQYTWKYTLHMKNCQTPNTWPLSISFPFRGLQEYHFQWWTHNLRVLKTCFQRYTKWIRD